MALDSEIDSAPSANAGTRAVSDAPT